MFRVPDTFARDASTEPPELGTFQRFNLKMTADNAYSLDAPLSAGDVVANGTHLPRRNSTLDPVDALRGTWSRSDGTGAQGGVPDDAGAALVRPVLALAPPDAPRFSALLTHHVAAMMHRYWGDAIPRTRASSTTSPTWSSAPSSTPPCPRGPATRTHAGRPAPAARLVVVATMGQAPIDHRGDASGLLVLDDGAALARFLGAGPAEQELAMHPMCSLAFGSARGRRPRGGQRLARVADHRDERSLFETIEQQGASGLTFRTGYRPVPDDDPHLARLVSDPTPTATYESVGLAVRSRLGGGNTAYHIPEGILVDYAPGMASTGDDRRAISALDVAPSLLANVYGVNPPERMKGSVDAELFGLSPRSLAVLRR